MPCYKRCFVACFLVINFITIIISSLVQQFVFFVISEPRQRGKLSCGLTRPIQRAIFLWAKPKCNPNIFWAQPTIFLAHYVFCSKPILDGLLHSRPFFCLLLTPYIMHGPSHFSSPYSPLVNPFIQKHIKYKLHVTKFLVIKSKCSNLHRQTKSQITSSKILFHVHINQCHKICHF